MTLQDLIERCRECSLQPEEVEVFVSFPNEDRPEPARYISVEKYYYFNTEGSAGSDTRIVIG
jgi:hypothetical protein